MFEFWSSIYSLNLDLNTKTTLIKIAQHILTVPPPFLLNYTCTHTYASTNQCGQAKSSHALLCKLLPLPSARTRQPQLHALQCIAHTCLVNSSTRLAMACRAAAGSGRLPYSWTDVRARGLPPAERGGGGGGTGAREEAHQARMAFQSILPYQFFSSLRPSLAPSLPRSLPLIFAPLALPPCSPLPPHPPQPHHHTASALPLPLSPPLSLPPPSPLSSEQQPPA